MASSPATREPTSLPFTETLTERTPILEQGSIKLALSLALLSVKVSVNGSDVGSLVAGDEAISLHPMVEPLVFPGG